MAWPTIIPIEIILEILEYLQPSDQLSILQAFPSLAALMTHRHISKDEHGNTILHILAKTGNSVADIIRCLLPHVKGQINSQNQQGETALMYAAAGGHELIVRLFLENNANVNVCNRVTRIRHCKTALSYAVEHGHEAVVQLLLDQPDVDVNLCTPLLCAITKDHHSITMLLLSQKNINPWLGDENNRNALSLACERGLEDVFEILISHKDVDINSQDDLDNTTVTWAAQSGHINILRWLLACGAEANPEGYNGRTPLSCAAWAGKDEIVEVLLAWGDAKADLIDDWGRTPLSYAAESGCMAAVKLLLAHGAKPDSVDMWKWTPISYAKERRDKEILALLTQGLDKQG